MAMDFAMRNDTRVLGAGFPGLEDPLNGAAGLGIDAQGMVDGLLMQFDGG